MNNSKLALDSISFTLEAPVDATPRYREREMELTNIIGALQEIRTVKAWSSLKTLVFDGLTGRLREKLSQEARKENPDSNRLNRLAGELKWAEAFSDLSVLENTFRVELANVKKALHGSKE